MPKLNINQAKDSMVLKDRRLFIAKIWLTSTVVLFAFLVAQFLFFAVVSANNKLVNDNNANLKNSVKINTQKLASGNADGKDAYVKDKFKKLFTSDEIMKISSRFWSYKLLVDGKPVTDNKITAPSGDLTVTIIQKEIERVLPVSLHVIGMVTGGDMSDIYYEHLTFMNVNKTLTKSTLNGVSTANYTIKNVKSGQSISFSLSEPLKNLLGLSSIDIKISVK